MTNQQLEQIFQYMPQPCMILEKSADDLKVLLLNKAFEDSFEVSASGLQNQTFQGLCPVIEGISKEFCQRLATELNQLIEAKDSTTHNWTDLIEENSEAKTRKRLHVKANKIQQLGGENLLISLFFDLSPIGIAEMQDEVERLTRTLSLLEEKTKTGRWELDLATNKMSWSDELFRISGLDPQSVEPSVELAISQTHPDDIEQGLKDWNAAIELGIPYNTSMRLVPANGGLVHVNSYGLLIKDENGKPKKLFGILQNVTEHKKLLEEHLNTINELKSQNELFTIILDNIPIGLALGENNTLLSKVLNRQFSDIYGWDMTQLPESGKFMKMAYPDENYRTQLLERISKDLEDNTKDSYHWNNIQVQTADGSKRVVNCAQIKLPNSRYSVSTVIDVTNLATKTKQLEESNLRYQYVTKATSDAIWDWDFIDEKIFWGEGYENLFGYKVVGYTKDNNDFNEKVHPDDREETISSLRNKMAGTDSSWTHEYRFLKADGTYADVLDKGFIIRDEKGNAIRVVGAMQDITIHKKEQQHLRLLESVIKTTHDAIVITEAEPITAPGPRILFCNDAFEKITGYTPAETIGKTPRMLQGPLTDKASTDKIHNSLKAWEPINITLLNYKKNGETFWNNLTVVPLADESGWYTHWISVQRDVTAEVEARQKVLRINNLYSFTNRVNHFILQAKDERAIYREACKAAVENGGFSMAMVGHFTDDNTVSLIEYDGLDEQDKIHAMNLFEQSDDPVIQMKSDGKYKICNDIPALPETTACRLYKAGYPLGSCIKMPIIKSGHVIGVFNLYSKDKDYFKDEELAILNRVTGDINTTLELIQKERDRIKATRQLKRSTENLKQSQAIAHIGNWEYEFNTQTFEWSEEACRIHGRNINDNKLSFEEWTGYLHEEDKERVLEAIKTFSIAKSKGIFHRIVRKDGTMRHVFANTQYIYNSLKKIVGIRGITHDVTDFKETEIALLNSQKKLTELLAFNQTLIETSPIGIVAYNGITGQCVTSNRAHVEVIGADPEVVTRINFYEIKPWRTCGIFENVAHTLATGEIKSDEVYVTTSFGKSAWLDYTVMRFYDKEIPHILMLVEDVSERKNTAIALQQTQEKYKRIIETTQEGILVFDKDDRFTFVNQRFCKMIEYTYDEIIGHQLYEFKEPSTIPAYKTFLDSRRYNYEGEQFNSHYITKSGKKILLHVSATPMKDDAGEFQGVLAMVSDITERRKLEELFAKSSKQARIGSWEIDLQTGNALVSDLIREIIEKPQPQQITISTINEVFKRPEDVQLIMDVINNPGNGPLDTESLVTSMSGQTKWVHIIGEFEWLGDKAIKFYGSLQDIDVRKKAQIEALKSLEEKNQILESIDDAFFAIDEHFIVTHWNHQAEKMLHTPRTAIIGYNLWDVFGEARNNISFVKYHEALLTKTVIEFEDYYEPLKKWFQVSVYPSTPGLSVFIKDITQRKQAEQQMRNERNMLRTLIDNVPDTIYYKDTEGRKLISNKVDYQILGASSEQEVLGKTDLEVLEPELGEICYQHDIDIVRTGKPLVDFEMQISAPEQDETWLLTTKLPLRDENEKIIGVLGIGRNITQRKNNLEELRRLNEELELSVRQLQFTNKELEQFAYVASHDLQEPLRMVTSFLAQIERKYNPLLDEKGRQYIHFAVDGAKRMRQIILDLLEYSRTGRIDFVLEQVDTMQVVQNVIHLHNKSLLVNHGQVIMRNLPVIKTASTPFTQVLQNLVGNSLKYHKENEPPVVEVDSREMANEWLFSVKDNGIGIAPEYYNKIFIIFQRLHRSEEFSGTGIGLAITKKLVENMGGKIWVESQVSAGSTFYFTIPKNQ